MLKCWFGSNYIPFDSHGLADFLEAQGIGWMKRKVAVKCNPVDNIAIKDGQITIGFTGIYWFWCKVVTARLFFAKDLLIFNYIQIVALQKIWRSAQNLFFKIVSYCSKMKTRFWNCLHVLLVWHTLYV